MQLPQNKNECFKPSQIVYSQSFGVGVVKAIVGNKLFLEVGQVIQEIDDYQQEIEDSNLLPIEEAPQTSIVKYDRFAAFLHKYKLISHTLYFLGNTATYDDIPQDINPIIKQALSKIGIKQLYSHQVQAWAAYKKACDIALLTETSSGKSLAFLIPTLHECLQNNSVLIFFNLKGLAFDQSQKIEKILKHIPAQIRPKVLNINGDTPRRERLQKYTNTPTIICATPDAWNHDLAASKNNNWQLIGTLLKIKLIVIDELHLYNGSFGAHFALLNKRMQLKIEMLGGKPEDIRYIFASATIGNPQTIAQSISNRNQSNLAIVSSNGAKSHSKRFICLRNSAISTQDAAMCLSKLVELEITTICFSTSRAQSKAIAKLAASMLDSRGKKDLAKSISAFYGAMKPAQRIKIINGIHTGKIKGIVSTSALEAGIDIANIDAVIVCKYPGTILSFLQQIGRAGRHGDGLIVFIPSHHSLIDNYYGQNPQKLFTDDAEIISFNPSYKPILSKHIIACCSESKPTQTLMEKYFGDDSIEIVDELLANETLVASFNKRIDANPNLGYYHINIKMRGDDGNIDYINKNTGEEFETSSSAIAIREVYPGAIYPAQDIDGKPVKYRVDELDLENNKSILLPIDKESKLYTVCKSKLQISKIKPNGEENIISFGSEGKAEIKLVPIWGLIEELVEGYELHDKEIRWTCNSKKCYNYRLPVHLNNQKCPNCLNKLREIEVDEIIDDVTYPKPIAVKYETAAIEVMVNDAAIAHFQKYVSKTKQKFQADMKNGIGITREVSEIFTSEPTQLAVHTIAHQLILALPLVRHESNSKDIEFVLNNDSKSIKYVVGYFLDTTPDGNGGCETLVEYSTLAIKKALILVENCRCKHGCHKCTTIHRCPDSNESLYKYLGVNMLH